MSVGEHGNSVLAFETEFKIKPYIVVSSSHGHTTSSSPEMGTELREIILSAVMPEWRIAAIVRAEWVIS